MFRIEPRGGAREPPQRHDHFKGKDWNFVHRDPRQRHVQYTAGSKTLERKRTEKTRLPAAMYDVAAA